MMGVLRSGTGVSLVHGEDSPEMGARELVGCDERSVAMDETMAAGDERFF